MQGLIIPDGYRSELDHHETQVAVQTVKKFFEETLSSQLNLLPVCAPLFVTPDLGMNDTLKGVEKPVTFQIKNQDNMSVEIMQSLAKWKRHALQNYGFSMGEGLITDMSAIRPDEIADNIHSVYVDQWDWEKIITKYDRTEETLRDAVKKVYKALKKTEKYMTIQYDYIEEILPKDIYFITTQELEDRYPGLSSREKEYRITKEKGAVFLMKIGDVLSTGQPHELRAPDYDDWSLNGDILVYYPLLDITLELSSMGVRVDEEALMDQLKKSGCESRADLPYQRAILDRMYPYTIGGGIGISRTIMFMLRKAHIGEIQVSVWPDEMISAAWDAGIRLL